VNGHQKAVIWIGLILIVLNLFVGDAWKQFWKTITTSGASGNSDVPGLPNIPGVTSPGFAGIPLTVPTNNQAGIGSSVSPVNLDSTTTQE
jgi:hypothetical protein